MASGALANGAQGVERGRRGPKRPPAWSELGLDVLAAIAEGARAPVAAGVLCRWIQGALPRNDILLMRVDSTGQLVPLAGCPHAATSATAALGPAGPSGWGRLELAEPGLARDWWGWPVLGAGGTMTGVVGIGLRRERAPRVAQRAPRLRATRLARRCASLLDMILSHETLLRRLEEGNARLDAALSNVRQGLCFFDRRQRLIVANGRYSEIYNIPPGLVQPGVTLAEIVVLRQQVGSGPRMQHDAYLSWRNAVQHENVPSDTVVELVDGRFVAVHHRPMPDGGWVATHEDVTERRAAEEHIRHLASHDALTGLANRLLLQVRLDERLATLGTDASAPDGFAILLLDLDRFKAINDRYGHPAGDALLQAVAARLHACVRDEDTITRLGGDEFAILLSDMHHRGQIAALARRVHAAVTRPYDIASNRLVVGASIGLAVAPEDGTASEMLLRHADLALYHAKTAQPGTACFFDWQMNARLERRLRREVELREALAAGSFELDYQPIVALGDGMVAGFEALLRWRHPAEGRIAPAEFMTVAEETGLIVPIGAWVLQAACEAAAGWLPAVNVAVNISAVQFADATLVAAIDAALARSGLAPSRLELEITETALLSDTAHVLAQLHLIRARGVRVSLDDFGTGQSSLSHVQAFPFDKIKIDRSFVRNIGERRESRAVVRAIGGLGRSLQVRTTAEGIETEEQLAMVRAEGCTEGQGYLFGRPMPNEEVAAFLRRAAVPPTLQVIF